MERDIDVLAELESLDNGKCVKIARVADLAGSIAHIRYDCDHVIGVSDFLTTCNVLAQC